MKREKQLEAHTKKEGTFFFLTVKEQCLLVEVIESTLPQNSVEAKMGKKNFG